MARYWVGGTGNWDASTTTHWSDSSGGAGGQSVPTSTDDVYFDLHGNEPTDAAYTVTITATANCANLDISFTGTTKVTLAGSTSTFLIIYGNLNLSGGTAQITLTFSGLLYFSSTATGKTITTNSVPIVCAVYFNGVGGGWTLQDAFTSTGANSHFTITNGTFETGDKNFTVGGILSITGTATRTVTLGSSTVQCRSWNATTTTLLTWTANTAAMTVTGSTAPSFDGGGLTYYNVTMTGASNLITPGTVTGANTFNDLTMLNGSSGCGYTFSANQTINGTLTLTGLAANGHLFISSSVIGTAITLTAAAIAVTNTGFRDITGAGAASWDMSAVSSGNCGGNSMKALGDAAFTSPADQHWTNTSGGSWSTAGNWTSRVPLPQDNVFMNCAFTTSRTVTADMPRLGKSIDWTGATWTTSLTWTLSTTTIIFGSLTMIDNLTLGTGTTLLTFEGRDAYTFSSNAKTFEKSITLKAPTGSLTLVGNLTMGVTRTLTITNGTLSAVNGGSNYVISAGLISVGTAGTLTLGSATHLLTGTGTVFTGTGTITASTGTLKITDTSNTAITFAGGTKTYNNIWFSRGASTASNTISGNNIFVDFKDDGSEAHSILFTAASTQRVTTFTVSGTAGKLITINSTTTGIHTLIKDGAGTIICEYLSIQHSVASPAATWYARNSTNNQGVATVGSGWVFIVAITKSLKYCIKNTTLQAGPLSPGTMANESLGGVDWSNPDNAKVADSIYAIVVLANQQANQLKATNFGFTIPTNALINGIVVEAKAKTLIGNVAIYCQLIKSGGSAGMPIMMFTTSEQYYSSGVPTNPVNTIFTPAVINSSTFGCVIFTGTGVTDTISVDHIRITVYYTLLFSQKILRYQIKTVPSAITKGVIYRIRSTPAAATKGLQYEVVGAVPVNVQKSIQYAIKTTPVAQEKGLQYVVKATIAAIQKALKYAVPSTPAAKTKGLIYRIKTIPAATGKALQYVIKGTPSAKTKALVYRIITIPAAKTKSLIYAVKLSIPKTKGLQYTIKQAPAAKQKSLRYEIKSIPPAVTKTLKYAVITIPAATTKALAYRVRIAPKTKGLQYAIKSPVLKTKGLIYCIKITPVATQKTLKYDILMGVPVLIQKGIIYAIKVPIAKTKGLKYTIPNTPAAKTKTLKYEIKTIPVAITKGMIYRIRATPTAKTKNLTYEVKTTPLAVTKGLQYRVRQTIPSSKGLIYKVRGNVSIPKGLTYHVQTVATPIQKALRYEILISKPIAKGLRYAITITPAAKTKALRYAIRKTISAIQKNLAYKIKLSPSKTKGLRYTITTPATPITKGLTYRIVTTPATTTKTLQYKIHAPHPITKSLKYVVISTPVAVTKPMQYVIRIYPYKRQTLNPYQKQILNPYGKKSNPYQKLIHTP